VQDGEVTFEGHVPDRGTKFDIEELADAVLGVREVHNRLRVQRHQDPRGERARDDGERGAKDADKGEEGGGRGGRKTSPILKR
jgi:hypothetical protein